GGDQGGELAVLRLPRSCYGAGENSARTSENGDWVNAAKTPFVALSASTFRQREEKPLPGSLHAPSRKPPGSRRGEAMFCLPHFAQDTVDPRILVAAFDFTWQGVRAKEYTGLLDTPENRRRCQHTMRLVDAAIRRGDFDYRAFFPRGSRLHVFHPNAWPDGLMRFQDYALRWHPLRSPFRSDGTVVKDADLHPSTWLHDESTIRRHLIPAFGPLSLREVDVARVNEFRRQLISSGLTGKTVS